MSNDRAYGCLFCTTGKERFVAQRVEQVCPGIRAVAAILEKHKSVQGKKFRVEEILLPGYVIFEAPPDTAPGACLPREHVLRLLADEQGVWQLGGSDEAFARWLFSYGGVLRFSKARREDGGWVQLLSGPLKDMEMQIVRFDRRGRSGQVRLVFNGHEQLTWLGFELIEDSQAGKEAAL